MLVFSGIVLITDVVAMKDPLSFIYKKKGEVSPAQFVFE
jgi:hypothetical protein